MTLRLAAGALALCLGCRSAADLAPDAAVDAPAPYAGFAQPVDFPTGPAIRWRSRSCRHRRRRQAGSRRRGIFNDGDASGVSVLFNGSTPGTPMFEPHVDVATGTAPAAVAVGDIDGDGKLDLVVADGGDAQVVVVLGAGTPEFPPTPAVKLDTGPTPAEVAVADFDGDGKPDVAVLTAGALSIFRNTTTTPGTPTFAPRTDLLIGATSFVAGDIDGDGKPDLAVVQGGGTGVGLFANASTPGTLTFPAVGALAGLTSGSQPVLTDVDGDGKLDLVLDSVMAGTCCTATIALSTTAKGASPFTFQPVATITTPATTGVGDIDGDGRPDLIALGVGIDEEPSYVLLDHTASGATAPSYGAAAQFGDLENPRAYAVLDVDGDGKPDLVVVDFNQAKVSVLAGT